MSVDANRTTARSGPVAHLTGCYPMASHTFIQREIASLRELGAPIITLSVRAPAVDHLTGPEGRDAAAETFYILRQARNPLVLLQTGLEMLAAPRRRAATIARAARTARPCLQATLWHVFHVIKTATPAGYLKDSSVQKQAFVMQRDGFIRTFPSRMYG